MRMQNLQGLLFCSVLICVCVYYSGMLLVARSWLFQQAAVVKSTCYSKFLNQSLLEQTGFLKPCPDYCLFQYFMIPPEAFLRPQNRLIKNDDSNQALCRDKFGSDVTYLAVHETVNNREYQARLHPCGYQFFKKKL